MKIVDQTGETQRHSVMLIAEDECDDRVLRDFAKVISRARARDKTAVLRATIVQEVDEFFPSLLLEEVCPARMPNFDPASSLSPKIPPQSQLEAASATD